MFGRSSQLGRGRTALIVAAAAIAVAVAAAWLLQASSDSGDASSDGGTSPGYSITVRQDGEVLRKYDLAALRALPQASVVIDGKTQDGPLLRTVLKDAGVDSRDSVEVMGAGIRDEGRLTLTARQVDRAVQLDFSDRGTVKVCGPSLGRADWVRDVVSIDAR